jgi:type VI protein secretion system component VasF
VAIFKKNRQFHIKPKYQKDNDENSEHDFQTKWQELKRTREKKSSILTSPFYMVLFLIAILVLWYFLGGYE